MKGMKKDYYILNNDTGEFVCKGLGGAGWSFTSDKKEAVKFTYDKAERLESIAKFDAQMIHKDNLV
ncbi:hypothetical protein MOD71_18670 [Bacillus haynesii]|uniref:hypothetical protein n=1 Tax=Bacillus haynesii TaxID=1925021 RepID=UPI00227DF3AD|nr:hypothetical protein [Bacillus haynesii]MCY8737531.1 hypothetical protein [Bacillus haynesii]